MDISQIYKLFLESGRVVIDSRNIIPGSIFFALKGPNFNGNLYANEALEKGCSYAIVDEQLEPNDRIIKVDNVLQTLQQISTYHRNKLNIPIICITGTNGKTTTKELVSAVLSKKYNVAYTQGNLNNHIGVPLTLLSMKDFNNIGVVEIGANHIGEIKDLCHIAQPNYGLITNIGKAHLEGFGCFENIINAKTELYNYIKSTNGKVFVNNEDKLLCDQSQSLDRIFYGIDLNLFASGKIINSTPFLEFNLNYCNKSFHVKTKLIGDYNFYNALSAIAIGNFFGIENSYIIEAIENYTPNNNRSQFKKTKFNNLIIDAYNANPTSMHASLNSFFKIDTKLPKSVILGEMKELGNDSIIEHSKIIEDIKQKNFENIFLVGDIFKKITSEFKTFSNVSELINYLQKNILINNYILLKGSNSIQLEKAIPYL